MDELILKRSRNIHMSNSYEQYSRQRPGDICLCLDHASDKWPPQLRPCFSSSVSILYSPVIVRYEAFESDKARSLTNDAFGSAVEGTPVSHVRRRRSTAAGGISLRRHSITHANIHSKHTHTHKKSLCIETSLKMVKRETSDDRRNRNVYSCM